MKSAHPSESLAAAIETLLAEPIKSAREREQTTFSRQLADTDGSVVLLGAGRLGRLCARALQ
ncbi:MAG TPA: hypothetical protein VHF69_05050, partial [Candidatus Synoicihabitans sp.]|nr:hypothetical protein [Candidatus Synoicihabitans sp.]